MATGTLGQAALTAATDTTVYTVPSSTTATFSFSVTNTGSSVSVIKVAIAATGTPAAEEFIEYDVPLASGDVLERTGLVASADKNLVFNSTHNNVIVNVYGYEA